MRHLYDRRFDARTSAEFAVVDAIWRRSDGTGATLPQRVDDRTGGLTTRSRDSSVRRAPELRTKRVRRRWLVSIRRPSRLRAKSIGWRRRWCGLERRTTPWSWS